MVKRSKAPVRPTTQGAIQDKQFCLLTKNLEKLLATDSLGLFIIHEFHGNLNYKSRSITGIISDWIRTDHPYRAQAAQRQIRAFSQVPTPSRQPGHRMHVELTCPEVANSLTLLQKEMSQTVLVVTVNTSWRRTTMPLKKAFWALLTCV